MDHESQHSPIGKKKLQRSPIGQKKSRWGFRGMTVRSWLELLLLPLVLALLPLGFNYLQEQRQIQIEDRRAKAERGLAERRAREEALQAYLTQMSTLMIGENPLGKSGEDSAVRTLARARTSTVMRRLDAKGNRRVIRFLEEAHLTENGQASINLLAGLDLRGVDLKETDLSNVDLSGADLSNARLPWADLDGVILDGANLSNAKLHRASLEGAFLEGAILDGADLHAAGLRSADLSNAKLRKANLEGAFLEGATLEGAYLYKANLSYADLATADLSNATLSNANLSNAGLSDVNLDNAKLSGANLKEVYLQNRALSQAKQHGVFEDNFSDKSGDWNPSIGKGTEPWIIGYTNDSLRVYNPAPPNTQLVSPGPLKGIEGATVEVDGTVTPKVPENSSMWWGIRCKAVGNGTSYYLGISSHGVPRIRKEKGNGFTTLKPSWSATDERTSAAFKEGTATNRLRADCSGSRITLEVNDQKILEAPADTEIKAAKIGLFVEDVDVDANVLFDNFVINGPKPLR